MNTREMVEIIEGMGYKAVIDTRYKDGHDNVEYVTVVEDGRNVSPTFYPALMSDITPEEFEVFVSDAMFHAPTMSGEELLDGIEDKVYIGLVPSGSGELYCHRPSIYEGCDEILYFVVIDGDETCMGVMKITNEILDAVGYTFDQLYKWAYKNTIRDSNVTSMGEFMSRACPIYDPTIEYGMYIVTVGKNIFGKESVYGAGVAVCTEVLDRICDEMETEMVTLIPSSKSEMLVIKDVGLPITSLIREVNATQLKPEEVLSNTAYVYTKGKGVEVYAEDSQTMEF